MKADEPAGVRATGGPARTVILGAADPCNEDPQTGFRLQLELDSRGAAIAKATFSNGNDKGFDDRDYRNPQPLVLLSTVDGDIVSMAIKELVLIEQKRQLRLDRLSWKSAGVERSTYGSQTARFEAAIQTAAGQPMLKLTQTYKVHLGSYLVDCDIRIENLAANDQEVRFNLAGPVGIGREDTRSDLRKVVAGFRTAEGQVISSRKDLAVGFPINLFTKKVGLRDSTTRYQQAQETRNDAQIKQAREDLHIGRNLPARQRYAQFLWAAITNKYFAAILRPVPHKDNDSSDWVQEKTSWLHNPDGDKRANSGDETMGINLKVAPEALGPKGRANSTKTYSFELYLGPKDKKIFDENEQYRNLGFVHTIDFMSCCCPAAMIRPIAFGILAAMKWMYAFIHNYGIVIIILVLLFRLAMHPITKKSQVSMNKFQKVMSTPEAQQIKKKYANNMAEQQKQMMQLYKKYGVHPAGQITSMLPMLVQMPIWISLWGAINTSIDLRGAPFLPFWITDLSAPDALFRFSAVNLPLLGKIDSFNLLPIMMGVAFYLQQKMMPSQATMSADPKAAQQQKIMQIMMIVMFPLLLYKGPSGVNLYIMSSVFAGVIEQYFIRKHIREKEQEQAKGLVAVTSKTGGKVKKKKPKPFYRMH
ncbi:MAG: YidC/Oxa1 family insertase periplasmic-domain containing protein [Planctomycetota bacterium]